MRQLAFFALLLIVGCSGGSGGSSSGNPSPATSSPTANESEAALISNEIINQTLRGFFARLNFLSPQPSNTLDSGALVFLACENAANDATDDGSAILDVDFSFTSMNQPTAFSLMGSIDFDNCDGGSGILDVDADGTVANDTISINIILDGSGDTTECSFVTVSNLSLNTSAPSNDLGILLSPIIIDGDLAAICGGQGVSCDFDNIVIDELDFNDDTDLASQDALAGSCVES